MKEGRSVILIIRSLNRLELHESTVIRVLSMILDAKKQYGEEASEQTATELMAIVDSCQTEDELLQKIDQMNLEIL